MAAALLDGDDGEEGEEEAPYSREDADAAGFDAVDRPKAGAEEQESSASDRAATETTGLLEGASDKEKTKRKDEDDKEPEEAAKRVKKVPVPFHRRPCATAKGMIILWTTVSVLLVSVVCGALLKFATPFPTSIVGPDGEIIGMEEVRKASSPVMARADTAGGGDGGSGDGDPGDGGGDGDPGDGDGDGGGNGDSGDGDSGDGDRDGADTRLSVKSPGGRRRGSQGSFSPNADQGRSTKGGGDKRSSKSSSSKGSDTKKSSSSSGGGVRGSGKKTKSGGRKDAKGTAASLGMEDLLPGETAAGCMPKSTEKVHGMYRQFHAGCAQGEDIPGCISGTKCQKCYMKGTPAVGLYRLNPLDP